MNESLYTQIIELLQEDFSNFAQSHCKFFEEKKNENYIQPKYAP